MRKLFSLFFLIVYNLSFNIVFAADLNLKQFPESPKEGEEVKLTLQSDKYDLNVANISWTIDGVDTDSGVGRKTLTMNTSRTGSAQIIVATVEQTGFNPDQIQKVVEANTNFILYEGVNSYVPSFYKGRRLPGHEGIVKAAFFSFKDGDIVGSDSNNSSNYTWKVNEVEKKDMSGQGRIANNLFAKVSDDNLNIKVLKTTSEGSVKTTQTNVPLQKTETLVYRTDEFGQNKKILGETETAKSIYLLVEPFFFSVQSKKDISLGYTWKINNLANKIASPWFVVFSGKNKETVKINLDVVNNQKITQSSSRGFTFKVE